MARQEIDLSQQTAIVADGELTPAGSAYADISMELWQRPATHSTARDRIAEVHDMTPRAAERLAHTVMREQVIIDVMKDYDSTFSELQHGDPLYELTLATVLGVGAEE